MTTTLDSRLALHRSALASCSLCGDRAPGVVPIQSLARSPQVMLVGQAPGKTECADARPFAGRAGRTLFRWLERAGVDEETFRRKVYIAAVTRCYPGPSPSGRGDRVPSPLEQGHCGQWLDAEVSLIRPRLIIPVGRLAIDRFVGKDPLNEVIGREHAVLVAGRSTAAIPLPHPSGASSWIHEKGHAQLLDQAIGLLRERLPRSLYL